MDKQSTPVHNSNSSNNNNATTTNSVRNGHLRSSTVTTISSSSVAQRLSRKMEERSSIGQQSRPEKRHHHQHHQQHPPPPAEKMLKSASTTTHQFHTFSGKADCTPPPEKDTAPAATTGEAKSGGGGGEKVNLDLLEWPRIFLFLLGYAIGLFSSNSPGTHSIHKTDHYRFRTNCAPAISQSDIHPMLLHRIYNNTSPYSNFPPPDIAPLLLTTRVHGWGSTNAVFSEVIASTQPKTIIEVGTFLGASALHMANLTRGLNTLILCIDDFRGWVGFRDFNKGMFNHLVDVNGDVILMQQFMQNVMDAGEERRILPVPFSTGAALSAFCDWGVYGDLVEVDAGHDFHSAWTDINRAWALVASGGVMFGHDYNLAHDNHGVRRAVNLFADVMGLKVYPRGKHWVLPRKN